MSAPDRKRVAPRRDSSVSREAILEAAVRVTARDGLSSATLSAMAREAGTSKPLLLYHFGSRNELLRQMASRVLERLVHVAFGERSGGASQARPGRDNIAAIFAKENRTLLSAVSEVKRMGARDPTIAADVRGVFELLARRTAHLIGGPQEKTLPYAHALVVAIHGYADLWVCSGDPDPTPYIDGATRVASALVDRLRHLA